MNINVEDLTNTNHFIQVNAPNLSIPNQYYLNGIVSSGLNIFTNNHRVPDVQRYVASITNNNVSVTPLVNKTINLSKFNDILVSSITEANSILLILESPHKDEYAPSALTPIAPAQGQTGDNIDHCIQDVLNEIASIYGLSNGKYHLIICNPIPYMCSLGAFTKSLNKNVRNNVWDAIWNISTNTSFIFRDEFVSRFKAYNPKYIINCCTKDKNGNKKALQRYVTEELIKHYPELYEMPHPCGPWWCKKKIVKIIQINQKIVYIKKIGIKWGGSTKTTYFPKGNIKNTYSDLIQHLNNTI